MPLPPRPLSAALLSLLVLMTGCTVNEEGAERNALGIRDAWVRPAADTTRPTAAYFTLVNTGTAPDTLVSARTPAARTVEIHESIMQDGVMRMRPVDRVVVPPGDSVALRPGGLHLMLIGLTEPLVVDDGVSITLSFADGGSRVVELAVRQP